MSGQSQGVEVDLSGVNGAPVGDGGVEHGALLMAFAEAVMGEDEALRSRCRRALLEALTPQAFVDACAVVGAFNVVDRIANATGIPLDDGLKLMGGDLRQGLDLARFASSENTPEA